MIVSIVISVELFSKQNYNQNMVDIPHSVIMGSGSGGGSTGCCEGIGSLYDLDNGTKVLITTRNGIASNEEINNLEKNGVVIVDQFDSKGCKKQSYENIEFGIICNGVYGKADGISLYEQKWGWEHR